MRDIIALLEGVENSTVVVEETAPVPSREPTPLEMEYMAFVESQDFIYDDVLEEGRVGALAGIAMIFTGLALGACTWVNNTMSSGISVPARSGDTDLYGNPKSAPEAVMAVRQEERIGQMPTGFRQDWAYLAVTIYGEARGETPEGKQAVGSVIVNRMKDGRWGDSIQAVVTQSRTNSAGRRVFQFSCWGDDNKDEMEEVFANDRRLTELLRTDPKAYQELKDRLESNANWKAWQEAKKIAYEILRGARHDNTGGANHYHTVAVDPSWNREMPVTATVGAHKFYRA